MHSSGRAFAVLLAIALAATVVVVVYLHLWVRVWRPAKSQLYRNVYTAAAVWRRCRRSRMAASWTASPMDLRPSTSAVSS